ncbi:MAG: hypothetical protein A2W25_07405 [candidate division Zixibacteria bacterium RBG_16_53_22]|nr:MAG: hypothetical protein A2W25_07405 [candidate division Zixibacteria bacterium RBG_16_53_22]
MKKFSVVFLTVALMAFMPLLAQAQVGEALSDLSQFLEFNSLGGGARAAGMGGAFLGLSEGEYAYSWNPGALIFAEKKYVGIQFVSAADKFVIPVANGSSTLDIYTLQAADVKRDHFSLDFGGFGVPFSFMDRNWAVGGGYRNIFDLDMNYESESFYGDINSNTMTDGVDAISVALAGLITDNLGFGVTANSYVRGTERNAWLLKAEEFYTSTDPFPDTIDIWDNETSHYSGVNFDLGLAASFGMFKAGAVMHTPFNLKQDVKFTRTYMFAPLPIGAIDRITITTDMPLGFSAGVAVMPIEKLTLALDLDSRPMSKTRINVNWEVIDRTDYEYDPDWENLTQFRIGAEYMLNAGFASLPLRLGFRNYPSIEKELISWSGDSTGSTSSYGDQINTNIITFGSGLHFEKAWIDFAYQFGSSSYDSHIIFFSNDKIIEQKRDYSRLFVSAGMYF